MNDKIREEILKAAKEGRISCTMARKLARELQVTPKEIGQACNDLKVKIFACELGCFE